MSQVDFSRLVFYQSKLPSSIQVKIGKSIDGGFWVEILNLSGCFTQAEDVEQLFVMVNDAVYTYFDIPTGYFPFLPRYFPNDKLKKKIQTWDKCIPASDLKQSITVSFFIQGATC